MGWTFAFRNYYLENITLYLNNPYFQAMADIVDPYGRAAIFCTAYNKLSSDRLAYFDRYHKTKILQFQGADDEFFLPDSEVNIVSILLQKKNIESIFRIISGAIFKQQQVVLCSGIFHHRKRKE